MFKLFSELETELQWQDLQPVLREECDLNITPDRQVPAQSGISVLFPTQSCRFFNSEKEHIWPLKSLYTMVYIHLSQTCYCLS